MGASWRWGLVAVVGAWAAGCGGGDTSGVGPGVDATGDTAEGKDAALEVGGDAAAAGVTWHGDVRALVETRCASCHVAGGAAPFALESWAQVQPLAPMVVAAVEARRMPPWPMDPSCRPVEHARHLTEAQIATFVGWREAGFPEGDPADYVAPEVPTPVAMGAPQVSTQPEEAYAPSRLVPDDYRCLTLPHAFEQDTYLVAHDIAPDQKAIVHHVIVYEVPESGLAKLEALDAAEAGPGYTCYGGPKTESVFVAGWVPGAQPVRYPEGAALRVRAGSRLVMQVHYNVLGLAAGDPTPADRTRFEAWALPAEARPSRLVHVIGFADGGISIPAGDPASEHVKTFDVPLPATIIGTAPHMHQLGAAIQMTLTRPDGAEECLTDVPAWDFNWQQFYQFPPEAWVEAHLFDQLTLRCVFDNSAENQPVVNGEQLAPRDVTWGEGTLDEMCLNYLVATTPFHMKGTGETCDGFADCQRQCPSGEAECTIACMMYTSTACLSCATQEVYVTCGQVECPVQLVALGGCLDGCDQGTLPCALGPCASELAALQGCIEGPLEAGACDGALAKCETAFGAGR